MGNTDPREFFVVENTIQYYVLELELHTHDVGTLHTVRQSLPQGHRIVKEEIVFKYDPKTGDVPVVRVLIRVDGTE